MAVAALLVLAGVSHVVDDSALATLDMVAGTCPWSVLVVINATVGAVLCWLGTRLLLVDCAMTRLATIGFLVGSTGFLAFLGLRHGWGVRCGCFSSFVDSSVASGLLRNSVLVSVCVAVDRVARSREDVGALSV